MSLTVLSVAYPLALAGPDAVGGAEQILSRIDHALTAAGHRSLVIACEGSKTTGELICTGPLPDKLTEGFQEAAQSKTRAAIEQALRDYAVDVIHLHGLDFATYLPETEVPVMATLHLPPSWYPAEIFNHPNCWIHCVSSAQRRACPPGARLLPDIPNGVPVSTLLGEEKEPFVLSMGRICPEKGFHLAAQAAIRAGVPFVLAGEVFGYDAHQDYFNRVLLPLLNGNASFIGPVSGDRKNRLLARARCVLIPSLVPETSSLVALEAMAAGTPVIAFPAGALAGLVQDGKTGFLVEGVDQMAAAICRSAEISSEACRQYVAENFSVDRMTTRYLDLYQSFAARGRPARGRPRQDVQVQLVRDAAGLASMVPEWRQLFRCCPAASPFQSPDWLQPWWECFGSGVLTMVAVRHEGDLIGMAPLYIEGRTVRFLGVSISDYGDVLAASGWERTVAGAVVDALCSLESEWTLCDLDELPTQSPLLLAKIPARYSVAVTLGSVCPYVDLHEFCLSSKQRRSISSSRHRLQRECPEARFETVGGNETEAFVNAFIELHEARWSERTGTGVLANAAVQRFHQAAIPRLQSQGLARLHVLRSHHHIVSVLYCLAHGLTLYYYLGGFNPRLERLGPGTLLIDYTMEQARQEGFQTLDFLRGAEEYKYRWGAIDRQNRRLQMRNECRA